MCVVLCVEEALKPLRPVPCATNVIGGNTSPFKQWQGCPAIG